MKTDASKISKALVSNEAKSEIRRPIVVWLTGLSGSGKTTIAQGVSRGLNELGCRTQILDADILRRTVNKDLGFSREDRFENVRRIGHKARNLARSGVIPLVAAITPYRAMRDELRKTIDYYCEVYVDAPLEICERRDPKGLYAKARAGLLVGFTGIDDPYEPPQSPEVLCRTHLETIEVSVARVRDHVIATLDWHTPVRPSN